MNTYPNPWRNRAYTDYVPEPVRDYDTHQLCYFEQGGVSNSDLIITTPHGLVWVRTILSPKAYGRIEFRLIAGGLLFRRETQNGPRFFPEQHIGFAAHCFAREVADKLSTKRTDHEQATALHAYRV